MVLIRDANGFMIPIQINHGMSHVSDDYIDIDANNVRYNGTNLRQEIDNLKYAQKRYNSAFMDDPNPAIDVNLLNQFESGEEVEFKINYQVIEGIQRGKLYKDSYRIYIQQDTPIWRTFDICRFDWTPLTDERVQWKDMSITMLRRYTPTLEILGQPTDGAVIAVNAEGKFEWKTPEQIAPPPKKKDIFSLDDYLNS